MKKILTISNSDSGGGSGIQGDIKTITMLGCYATSVITSLNAQNTLDIQAQYDIPAAFIAEQINSILSDIGTDIIKIGIVTNNDMVKVITNQIRNFGYNNLIYDISLINHAGKKLVNDDVIETIKQYIMPLANLVTPNLYEAELLSDIKIFTDDDAINAAKKIQTMGSKNVLIKGGHMVGNEIKNILLTEENKIKIFKHPRIKTENTHGAGGTLSSAIACYLVKNHLIESAIDLAIEYVISIISTELLVGKGRNPLIHNISLLDTAEFTSMPLP